MIRNIWLIFGLLGTAVPVFSQSPVPIEADKPISDPAIQRIRQALESDQDTDAPGILGDVLNVIRRRGSILDGSVLDPKTADPLETDRNRPIAADQTKFRDLNHQNAIVAENLLRTSRLLQSLPGGDEERRQLIRTMRIQATRLLLLDLPCLE